MTIATALPRLAARFGDRFSTSDAIRTHHGMNESYYPVTLPDAVIFPLSTEEVSEAVKICAEEDCPIIPWGVGTSLEGHALAFDGGVCFDLSRMDKVLAIHAEDLDAVVQPGVTREALNTELRATGLFFPVDPGANASLGGMAATRASGTNAVRYGTMRENVLAMEAVMADGRIVRFGGRARKSSSGYDMKSLIVGSEGTLAIITELTVRLYGIPESITSAVCPFETVEGAVAAVIETVQFGIPVARIEFLDPRAIEAFNAGADFALPVQPTLFLEFHGSEAGTAEQAEAFGMIAAEHGAGTFQWARTAEDRARLWAARHNAYYSIKALKPGGQVVTTDVCVPISRLAEALPPTMADIAASSIDGAVVAHVGDGNFHGTLLIDPANPADLKEAKRLAHLMNERALALGGTVTGEHGVGRGKMEYMEAEHGLAWDVMAEVKRALDPKNILNPGKIVRV